MNCFVVVVIVVELCFEIMLKKFLVNVLFVLSSCVVKSEIRMLNNC